VNVCGNSVNVIGLGNAAGGDDCTNTGGHQQPPSGHEPPAQPGTPEPPAKPHDPTAPPRHMPQGGTQPQAVDQLAETGSGLPLGATLTVGGGALLAGAVLYRKARATV
jgi:hypothetical protein